MKAIEAREVTEKVRGVCVIDHLFDGVFGRIRTAAANGDYKVFGRIVEIGTDNERQNEALWNHLRRLGYSVVVFGRAENQVCISWENARNEPDAE